MKPISSSVPVLLKVGQDELHRLLGDQGKRVLRQVHQFIKKVAVNHHWPLERIEVRYYRDPEVKGWEYVIVDLVLTCSFDQAEQYLLEFCDFLDAQSSHWNEQDQNILHEKIYFDVKAI